MCLNIGTPNNYHFPFGTNGKVVVFGVPILLKALWGNNIYLYKRVMMATDRSSELRLAIKVMSSVE